METLNIVVSEIILCLVVAWVLGFLAAWILFRKVQNEYEQEIEELEETLSYSSIANKMQEKEIIAQSLKMKKLEKLSEDDSDIEEEIIDADTDTKKEKNSDEELLNAIDSNLDKVKK